MTKNYKKVNNHSTVQPFNHSTAKQFAFTLAEVLVTLAIIGVVAALTIPTLIANTNEKGLNTSDSAFQRRLGEALKIMNLQGTLAGHETTQEFVDELGKHMKIIKKCPNDKLSECFVSEFKSQSESTISLTDLTTSDGLRKNGNYDSETIGVVFGNGIRALIAYNKNATQDQFDNSNTTSPVRLTSSGTGKNARVFLNTNSLAILYNLQERKDNNVYGSTGNIRGIGVCRGGNVTSTTNGSCVLDLGNSTPIDTCSDSTYDTQGTNNQFCSTNYWAGAKKACADKDMRLPEKDELVALFKNDNWSGKPTSGVWFWSATENGADDAWDVKTSGIADDDDKTHSIPKALCVGN